MMAESKGHHHHRHHHLLMPHCLYDSGKSYQRRHPRCCVGLLTSALFIIIFYSVTSYFDIPLLPDGEVEGWPTTRRRDVSWYLKRSTSTGLEYAETNNNNKEEEEEVVSSSRSSLVISQPELCQATNPADDLILLVFVFSPPTNLQTRAIIRDTWASWQHAFRGVRVAFMLGQMPVFGPTLQAKVVEESKRHEDIIQADFLDSYNNLTLKSLHMLQWLDTHCSSSPPAFVMKTDEDTFVNIPRLLLLLEYIQEHPDKFPDSSGFIFGNHFCDAAPDRNRFSKFYAPRYMYPGHRYPGYLAGAGYVMSRSALSPLYQAALRLPFFHMEDIFVTGMSRRAAGVVALHHEEFSFLREQRTDDPCDYMALLIGHQITTKEMQEVWNELQKDGFRCNSLKGATLIRDLERKTSPSCH